MIEPFALPPLSASDLRRADTEGARRRTEDQEKGFVPVNGRQEHLQRQDIEGARGELAVSLYLGLPWTGEGRFGAKADVGEDIEVKLVLADGDLSRVMRYNLILNPKNDPTHRYIRIAGLGGKYSVLGWAWGYEVKKPENHTTRYGGKDGSYAVKHSTLRPLSQLMEASS